MNLSNAVARVKGFFVSEVKVHPVTQGFRDEIAGAIAKQKAANEAGVPAVWPEYHHEGLIDQVDETDWENVPADKQQTFGDSRLAGQVEKPVGVIKAVIRAATNATDLALAEVAKQQHGSVPDEIHLPLDHKVLINPADIGHSEMYADLVKESGESRVMRPDDVFIGGADTVTPTTIRAALSSAVGAEAAKGFVPAFAENDSDTVDVQLTDMVFWDHFLTRLAPKGCLVVTDEHHLISKKSELARGYGVVRLTLTGEAGIVHVTKNGLNALFPTADGQFRAVSNNNRFDGKTLVQVEQAKGFLNGRY